MINALLVPILMGMNIIIKCPLCIGGSTAQWLTQRYPIGIECKPMYVI